MGGKSETTSSARLSSSWTGFFMGSAMTALTICLYQNRKFLFDLFVELRDEYKEGEDVKRGNRSLDLRQLNSTKALAMNEDEQVGFLADIVKQLWPYINIAVSDTIRDTAEPMFEKMLPAPLRSLHFTKIDLGTVPIRLDNVVVHDVDLESSALAFDLDVIWDGNLDIKLKADVLGSFGIKSVKLRGRMSILMRPLVPTTSLVQAIQYGFINTPEVSLKYSGMAHFAEFQSIDQTIKDTIKSTINSMMVLPRRGLYKLDKGSDFRTIHKPPLGILRINVIKGTGFVVEKGLLVDDVPDCFSVLKMGDITHRTKTVDDNLAPVWNETMDFVLNDHDQIVELECWDKDNPPLDADDKLGTATTSSGEMILSGRTLKLPLHDEENRSCGAFVTLGCDVLNLTSKLDSLSNLNDKHICGLLTITVLQAFGIPLSKEEAASFVQVTCGSSKFATSAVVDYPGVDCLNPWFDKAFSIPLKPVHAKKGKIPSIRFDLINGTSTELGNLVVTHDEIDAALNHTVTDTRRIGKKGAKIYFQICLQGVESPEPTNIVGGDHSESLDLPAKVSTQRGLRGSPESPLRTVVNSSSNSPQTATRRGDLTSALELGESEQLEEDQSASVDQSHVRVTLVGARGFQVRKTAFFKPDDVPDVYLKVTFGSTAQVWRTKTDHNNMNPVWNESKDFVLHSHGQVIDVAIFDQGERNERDLHLGSVRVTVGKVLLAGGTAEKEIIFEGRGIGAFITIKCQLVKH